jgi:hypothetical protein
MTALANRALFVVKEIRQLVIFYVIKQCVNDLTMGKLDRFILIRQGVDDDGLRYFLVIIGDGNGLPGAEYFGGQFHFLCRLSLIGEPGGWNHVAIHTGCGTLLALFFKGRVASGTAFIIQFGFVTPHTALIHLQPVHGLLQGDIVSFF